MSLEVRIHGHIRFAAALEGSFDSVAALLRKGATPLRMTVI